MPDFQLLGHLLRMRYRLLWAQTRTRNGKIALFVTFYIAVVCCVVLLALGGVGAGIAAVRSGRSELVARIVLAGFFANGLIASIILGFGLDAVFSDAALRRYPLNPLERLSARQLSAFLEPLWLLLLSLYLGLAVAFYALGVSSLVIGIPAALLLIGSNYLLARVIANILDRLIQTSLGVGVIISFIALVSMLPAVAGRKVLAALSPLAAVMRWTPPIQAAAAFAATSSVVPLLALATWCAVLLCALYYLERNPAGVRGHRKAAATWDTLYDRVAAWFGPRYSPIAGKALRYYLRSPRVRYNYVLAIPMLALFTFSQSRKAPPLVTFANALSAFAAVGFIGTAVMAVNQFGYDGGGFRRYFLLPGHPGDAFRGTTFVSLFLGLVLLPPSLVIWFFLAPLPTTPTMWLMLVSSALGGALFFNAASIWVSLYSPRRTDFTSSFGNNLSFGGNVLVIGGILSVMFFPAILRGTGRIDVVMRVWWMYPLFCAASAIFYYFSLTAGTRAFITRRERLLAVIEGRD